jgi:drug/metabolite transporter (DMT)-like permease
MPSDTLLLVLAGALAHAAWNFLAKRAAGGAPFVALYSLVSLALAGPLLAWFALTDPARFSAPLFAASLASALIHVVYSLALQRGYQVADLTVVYPIARGTGPLFSVCGAVLVLGERLPLQGWLGVATIVGGIVLIAGGSTLFKRTSPQDGSGLARGLRWGTLTGLTIAAYTLVDGWSVKTLSVTPLVFYALGLTLRSLLMLPFALRRGDALRAQWRANRLAIVGVGVLSPLAYTLVLYAMTRAPLAYVAPIRELSMMVAALLGARLLNEDDARRPLVGSALMAAGVVLMTLA